jgi:hypothetical protein
MAEWNTRVLDFMSSETVRVVLFRAATAATAGRWQRAGVGSPNAGDLERVGGISLFRQRVAD